MCKDGLFNSPLSQPNPPPSFPAPSLSFLLSRPPPLSFLLSQAPEPISLSQVPRLHIYVYMLYVCVKLMCAKIMLIEIDI